MCILLYFNVHTQAGLQFNRVPVGPDGNFLHPAFDKCFIEFHQVGRPAADEILKLGMSRIVYGACLAENIFEYLMGKDSARSTILICLIMRLEYKR